METLTLLLLLATPFAVLGIGLMLAILIIGRGTAGRHK